MARKAYLNKGYYDPILNQVITCIDEFKHQDDLSILDLGCGEGYYTQGLKKHFENSDIYGLLLLIWRHVIVKMLLGL